MVPTGVPVTSRERTDAALAFVREAVDSIPCESDVTLSVYVGVIAAIEALRGAASRRGGATILVYSGDCMRTLFEIIEAAKVGEPTTHDECLYALLAYAGLAHFDTSALRQLAFEPSKFRTPEREAEESFRRWKTALEKSPKAWLGPSNDPANEECRARVRLARRIFDKVAANGNGAT